jgi:hypothetical protein
MNSVHIEKEIRAPIGIVSGLTGDASTWADWTGISKVTIDLVFLTYAAAAAQVRA